MTEYLFTFANTHSAILAEGLMLERGIRARVMPLPVSISAGCGISLRVPEEQREDASRALDQRGIAPFSVYALCAGIGADGKKTRPVDFVLVERREKA